MKSNRIIMFSGAGISAESGVPTFRDVGGIWEQYNVDEVCDIQKFLDNKLDSVKRDKIFEFYNMVKSGILSVLPNDAHRKAAEWQKRYGLKRVVIITANVDDLFERAGCQNVIHVHGDLSHMHCHSCNYIWYIGNDTFENIRCPECDSRNTKPNVVFFGEQAPRYADMRYHFHENRMQSNDIVLYVGSSMSVIPPTALLIPPHQNKCNNRVLINMESNMLDGMFNHIYHGKATDGMIACDNDLVIPLMG